jgi:c-di-GMP-binding flagellar brake protein YcgR
VAASIFETIQQLADSATAKSDLTTTSGKIVRSNCIYKVSDSPSFFLIFPPKTLPEDLDIEQHCPISIKSGESTITLVAKIAEIKGDRTLELIAKNSVTPESLREYFRVDTKVNIEASFDPKSPDSQVSAWSLKGNTLDLSGSGLLAILPAEPPTRNQITLLIDLFNNQNPIECLAHVIRIKRLRREKYQVSFHFDSITPKNKDSIISFCLKEQRNRLRDKIQTID